jgi:hypothetical protein
MSEVCRAPIRRRSDARPGRAGRLIRWRGRRAIPLPARAASHG